MITSIVEPTNIRDALANHDWHQEMQDKYNAIIPNNTWHLVSPSFNKKNYK
jgi:hypothetical protein